MQDDMMATLGIYRWPSQAFWRFLEVQALRRLRYERPILEIGCGTGCFSGLLFDQIDDAIDINPRSVERARSMAGNLYRRVRCLDARVLEPENGGYATVFANCVMEHIPGLEGVLAGCFRGLRPGGKLIMTVPLVEMNDHLLLKSRWYAGLRQRQLSHVNLLPREGWNKVLEKVGFTRVEFEPYLSGRACRFWDAIDSPGCIGFGRYRVATGAGFLAQKLLPPGAKAWMLRRLAGWLRPLATAEAGKLPACAAVVTAWKV